MVNFWERIKSQNIVFILFLRRYKIPKEDIIAYDVHVYIRLLPFPHRMHPKTSSVWQKLQGISNPLYILIFPTYTSLWERWAYKLGTIRVTIFISNMIK